MKKIVVCMSMLLTAFSVIAATNVNSVNAVGYIKTTITNSEWKLISVPFDPIGTNLTFKASDLFTNNLPVGSKAYYWRSDLQQWAYSTYAYNMFASTNTWQPNASFISGQAIFLNAPASPVGESTFTLIGNVPVDQPIQLPLTNGFTLIGYPYPVQMNITNTVFGTNAVDQDQIYFWKDGQWKYITYTWNMFLSKYTWQPSNIVVEAGMGLFYRAASSRVSDEARPFPWD